ncbi:HlyD family efflux transporter periplasmic adaptor subunit [Aliiglaciecola sp. 3_MG-2023]|uniref:efflux RND transporter periplasmic adaptor subunit n=1 Tax=Aliiglaciecola sp. 3_MG-2023 TaxID=3062644 RepID=UPI0026E2F6DE|nr:efflux RND transporter periplasmic adaptor subunit [Aliiglaciecola sp. 3_MG-2023]MDO6695371.1 HlyD family efflux transporter periplasmic adaptor subunit [Aliiglaciecola sp. 3_MG-2023]
MSPIKYYFSVLCLVLLTGCEEEVSQIPTFEVNTKPFAISLDGFGEIEAVQAQKIVSPGRRPMVISWLADENSLVKKGDIIARFDAEQLLVDSKEEELRMALFSQDIIQSEAERYQQQNDILSEQEFVDYEFDFADKFAIDDLRVYSKLEIIDSFQNRDFLGAKDKFLDWKRDSVEQQNNSNVGVLEIKRRGHELKYLRHQQALSQLQVFAPNDGLLTYEKDRMGEKPSVGQTVFPGRAIAKIPNLNNMQARVFVLAKDAISLKPGIEVKVTLDAYPDKTFNGKVSTVSGYPRSIERGNPVTYYELVVALTQQDIRLMQPGRKLKAEILVQDAKPALLVPLQAIHHQHGQSYVYLKTGLNFEQRPVTTVKKNLYFVEVESGLQEGDVISLSLPEPSS